MRRLVSLALLAALGAAFVPVSSSAADTSPYVINAVLSQTGPAAFIGTSETKALLMIEDQVNKHGGLHGQPIKFDVADDQSNPLLSTQLVAKIAAGKPPFLIGPGFVATCLASMATIAQNGPLAYCLAPGIRPPAGGYMFSSGPDGDSNDARDGALAATARLEAHRGDFHDRCERASRSITACSSRCCNRKTKTCTSSRRST
jgi:branched-chain amino acid transport system substrate-binding protein